MELGDGKKKYCLCLHIHSGETELQWEWVWERMGDLWGKQTALGFFFFFFFSFDDDCSHCFSILINVCFSSSFFLFLDFSVFFSIFIFTLLFEHDLDGREWDGDA